MKHAILFLSFIFITLFANAQRSQEMLTKTVKTASEVRAKNFTDKLSSKVVLTVEQKDAIEDLIREYLDDSQNLIGNEEQAKILARLEEKRDEKAKKIVKTEEGYLEYQKCIEELKSQMGRGYGRK